MDQLNANNQNGAKNNMPVAFYYYISTIIAFLLIRWLILMIALFILGVTSLNMTRNGDTPTGGLGILMIVSIIAEVVAMFFACKISTKRIFKTYKSIDGQSVIKYAIILFVVFYIIYILVSIFTKTEFDLINSVVSFIISSLLFYLFTKKFIKAKNINS
ncbi:MAG: hypothetical protein WC465_04465 [Patescibacteria group bacterium]